MRAFARAKLPLRLPAAGRLDKADGQGFNSAPHMTPDSQRLTSRQETILCEITRYYLNHAKPIGSKTLREGRGLPWSAATLRNEMASLEASGYCTHCHTSSGRLPTVAGIRYFVDYLLETEEMPPGWKAMVEQSLEESQEDSWRLLRNASRLLSRYSDNVSLVVMTQGPQKDYVIGGKENFLGQPEFEDSLRLKDVLRVLEEEDVQDFIFRRSLASQPVWIAIGAQELPTSYQELFENLSLVASCYGRQNRVLGSVSVIGPTRMDYRATIPLVSYMAQSMGRHFATAN